MRRSISVTLAAAALLTACHDASDRAASIEPTLRSVTHRAANALGRDIDGVQLWTHAQRCELPDGSSGVYMIMDWNAGRAASITRADIDELGSALGAETLTPPATDAQPVGVYRREFLLHAGPLEVLLIASLDSSGDFGLSSKSSCV